MIRMLSAGESHGKVLVAIVEGLPAGISVDIDFINNELSRRQKGYGRGSRMKIEKDKIKIISGVRNGETIGPPIAFFIENLDYEKWKPTMSVTNLSENVKAVKIPRPGHTDLSGVLKYNRSDIRDILERSSARETALRVAAGGFFKLFLRYFGIKIYSHTISIGNISAEKKVISLQEAEKSPLRCLDPEAEKRMISLINEVKEEGDSIGGVSEIVAENIPVGLGSHISYDKRLDAKIGKAMLSIPSVKGVEIGPAFENTKLKGSQVHDEIFYSQQKGFFRKTNRAGGVEGGISNGENLIVRIAIKPIPTLMKPLNSVNIETKRQEKAHVERSDTCIVPAAGVIGEAMMAFVLSDLIVEKFGGDNISDIKLNFENYRRRLRNG